PPSPHGWRLQQAIAPGAGRAEVVRFEAHGDRIVAAYTKERSYAGDAVILASGQHIGGGLLREHLTREPLAGLGVFYDGRPVGTMTSRLRHLEYLEPSVQVHLGLRTDQRLHPLSEEGTAPYQNLHAAGAVLGGYDYGGAYGFGVPILTG